MRSLTRSVLPGKKRRSRGCLPVIVIAGLLVAAVLIVLFYLGLKGLRVEKNFQNGLGHFNGGLKQLQKSIKSAGKLKQLDTKRERQKAVADISISIKKSNYEFNLAGRDFKRMKKVATFLWETKTADLMFKSTSESLESLNLTKELILRADKIDDTLTKVSQGARKFQQAVNKSNQLIVLNNSGRYADVISAAPQVTATFKEAEDIVNNISNDSSPALSEYGARISQGPVLVDKLKMMAESGLNNQPAQYNKLKDEANKLMSRIMSVSKSKVIADPGGWVNNQLDEVKTKIKSLQKKSEYFKKKALDLWAKNT